MSMIKKLFPILSLLLMSLPVQAQWTHTAQTFNLVLTGGSVGPLTIPANAAIVANVAYFSGAFTSVTSLTTSGTTCNTPFALFSALSFTTTNRTEIWGASGCTASIGASGTIVATLSGGGSVVIGMHVVTGLGDPLVQDGAAQQSSGASSGTTISGPTYTPGVNGDFIISGLDPFHSCISGSGAGPGWTVNNPGSDAVCDAFVTSNSVTAGTPETPVWTLNITGSWTAITMGFKPGAPTNLRGPKGKIL